VLFREDGGARSVRLLSPVVPPSGATRLVTLPLSPGAQASFTNATPVPCRKPAQLCGHPADFITAIPLESESAPENPALLIAGHARGRRFEPGSVSTEAYALGYEGLQVVLDPRPCLLYEGGRTVSTTLAHPSGEVVELMRNTWQPSGRGRDSRQVI